MAEVEFRFSLKTAEVELKESFEESDETRQFALVVEGKRVYVNRDYLGCLSPVLRKVFFRDGFKSNPDDGMQMKDKTFVEFVEFLRCVCPSPKIKRVDETNIAVLLKYADEYDMADLRQRCIDLMLLRLRDDALSNALSLESVLAYADQYGMADVKDETMVFMGGQLNKEKVVGEGLIDYLKMSIQHGFGDLQKLLVPLVARLSIDQIKTAHAALPTTVLSALYQSKALHSEHVIADYAKAVAMKFICHRCGRQSTAEKSSGSSPYCCRVAMTKLDAEEGLACRTCVKRAAPPPPVDAPAAKCVCKYADFSDDLLLRD